MTRIIACCSGKGGVGKTTLSANLAVALTELGEDVIAVDGNLSTPDLGLHLGVSLAPATIHDVLKKRKGLRSAIYPHPLGFRIIPGSLRFSDREGVDFKALPEVTLNLLGRADFVILDTSASLGYNTEAAIEAASEVILITNPNLPSAIETLKTLKLVNKHDKKVLGVVINRVGGEGELTREEIEDLLEVPVIAEIPEDEHVQKSVRKGRPVVASYPSVPASREIMQLARELCGKPKPRKKGFWERLAGLLGLR